MHFIEAGCFGFAKQWMPEQGTPDLTANFPYASGVERARCGLTLMYGAETIEAMLPWAHRHARQCGVVPILSQWRLTLTAPSECSPATPSSLSSFDVIHLNKHLDQNLAEMLHRYWDRFEEDENGTASYTLFEGNRAWRPDFITRCLQIPMFAHLKALTYTVETNGYGPIDLITVKDPRILSAEINLPISVSTRPAIAAVAVNTSQMHRFNRSKCRPTTSGKATLLRIAEECRKKA